MDAINTGYTNYYANPTAATSTPSNFGPGQVRNDSTNDNSQSDNTQAQLQQTSIAAQAAVGYTTATRGSQLNISV